MNTDPFEKRATAIPLVLLLLVLSGGLAFAQQNLIVNGSFEAGGQPGADHFPSWDEVGPASNNSNYGTAQSSASPDMAEDGSFYAYFHGHPTDSSQDCLGQTVSLTVGANYTISYYLATDGPTTGSGAAMWVVIGTSFGIDLSQDIMLTTYQPNSASASPWQKFTTTITATSPTEILSFHGISSASAILLDNVSLTLAPPPAPQLSLGRSSTNTLIFAWNSSTNGFRLQANTDLSTTNWVTLTNTPVTVSSNNQVVLPTPSNSLYYRLALP